MLADWLLGNGLSNRFGAKNSIKKYIWVENFLYKNVLLIGIFFKTKKECFSLLLFRLFKFLLYNQNWFSLWKSFLISLENGYLIDSWKLQLSGKESENNPGHRVLFLLRKPLFIASNDGSWHPSPLSLRHNLFKLPEPKIGGNQPLGSRN